MCVPREEVQILGDVPQRVYLVVVRASGRALTDRRGNGHVWCASAQRGRAAGGGGTP